MTPGGQADSGSLGHLYHGTTTLGIIEKQVGCIDMPGNRRGHRHAAHLAAERAPQGLDGALSPICHGNLRNAHVIARAAHALGKPHFDLRTRGAPLERIDGEHHIEGAPHPTLARRGRQAMGAHGRTAYGRGSFHRGRRGRFPAIAAQSAL